MIPTGGALSEVSGRGLRHGRAPEPQPRPGCRVQKVVDLEAKCPSTVVRHGGTLLPIQALIQVDIRGRHNVEGKTAEPPYQGLTLRKFKLYRKSRYRLRR